MEMTSLSMEHQEFIKKETVNIFKSNEMKNIVGEEKQSELLECINNSVSSETFELLIIFNLFMTSVNLSMLENNRSSTDEEDTQLKGLIEYMVGSIKGINYMNEDKTIHCFDMDIEYHMNKMMCDISGGSDRFETVWC